MMDCTTTEYGVLFSRWSQGIVGGGYQKLCIHPSIYPSVLCVCVSASGGLKMTGRSEGLNYALSFILATCDGLLQESRLTRSCRRQCVLKVVPDWRCDVDSVNLSVSKEVIDAVIGRRDVMPLRKLFGLRLCTAHDSLER
mmetsp:Transcript_13051/g.17170  ORF Transcript_13051/g.17170 Transcript_13051/m.17170 type:complete len:140 (-) Transcript_13051:169-588(-)